MSLKYFPLPSMGYGIHTSRYCVRKFSSSPRKRGPRGSPRMTEKRPCVYLLASRRNGTLYTGVTSDVAGRLCAHRSGAVDGFTRRYNVQRLVLVEFHETMAEAIPREKRIEKWRRAWKLALIERYNPQWRDLADDLIS